MAPATVERPPRRTKIPRQTSSDRPSGSGRVTILIQYAWAGVTVVRLSIELVLLSIPSGCAQLGTLSPLAPLERSIVYQPMTYPQGNWRPVDLDVEDAWFESEDGTKLHGWYVPIPNRVASPFSCMAMRATSRIAPRRCVNLVSDTSWR